jgi:hypothetical protein
VACEGPIPPQATVRMLTPLEEVASVSVTVLTLWLSLTHYGGGCW